MNPQGSIRGTESMTRSRLSVIGRLWAAGLLGFVALLSDPCVSSSAQQVTPAAAEAKPLVSPGINSHQATMPEKRTTKVPILVYHHVSQSASEGSASLRRLTVTAEVFAQ